MCSVDIKLPWWLRWWRIHLQCRRPGFDPWAGKNPLEEGMAIHSSILAWGIPMDRGAWWAMVHGVAKSWTRLSDQAHTHRRSSRTLRCNTIPVVNSTVSVCKYLLSGWTSCVLTVTIIIIKEIKQTLESCSVSHGPHFLLMDKTLAFCLG